MIDGEENNPYQMALAYSFLLLIAILVSKSAGFSTLPQLCAQNNDRIFRHLAKHQLHDEHETSHSTSITTEEDNKSSSIASRLTTTIHSRRTLISACMLVVAAAASSPATASASTERVYYVKGTATLQSGASIDDAILKSNNAALYVTARPNKPDNVPRAILDGSRGKPPPVLSARFANISSFPFDFTLSSDNFTPEGATSVAKEGDASTANTEDVWWDKEDLIVSARLDTDGVAATRDPTDLVGRGIYVANKEGTVIVELQGRGMFGKSVTAKK